MYFSPPSLRYETKHVTNYIKPKNNKTTKRQETRPPTPQSNDISKLEQPHHLRPQHKKRITWNHNPDTHPSFPPRGNPFQSPRRASPYSRSSNPHRHFPSGESPGRSCPSPRHPPQGTQPGHPAPSRCLPWCDPSPSGGYQARASPGRRSCPPSRTPWVRLRSRHYPQEKEGNSPPPSHRGLQGVHRPSPSPSPSPAFRPPESDQQGPLGSGEQSPARWVCLQSRPRDREWPLGRHRQCLARSRQDNPPWTGEGRYRLPGGREV